MLVKIIKIIYIFVTKKYNLFLEIFNLPSFPPMSPVFAFEEKISDIGGFVDFLKIRIFCDF